VENIIKCASFCAKEQLNSPERLVSYDAYFTAYEKQFLVNYKEW